MVWGFAASAVCVCGPRSKSTDRCHSQQYARVKAAEEVAATPGLYETQGERRQRQQEETADLVEIEPRKEDVAQLESMIGSAPGEALEGVRLERGGDVAKLHSAADKGKSCVVHKRVRKSEGAKKKKKKKKGWGGAGMQQTMQCLILRS